MANIGPVGNAIYANQQTASVASVQNAHANRVDVQNMMAQAAANEKDETVLKIRPTEENREVDPDREHQKNEADQETARSDKREDNEEDEEAKPIYTLDIKV
ncbi:hypothetical protein JHD48_09155 [Sulfurimonas sp. SAG-AH-194-I05]|nr:hypothetical protein [Sulfurimonas sp. SAG-AH-194-I05]MDF1875901.1 hypothetical protein [Sulfurimonas sp. SAG-AH-194-I05]